MVAALGLFFSTLVQKRELEYKEVRRVQEMGHFCGLCFASNDHTAHVKQSRCSKSTESVAVRVQIIGW